MIQRVLISFVVLFSIIAFGSCASKTEAPKSASVAKEAKKAKKEDKKIVKKSSKKSSLGNALIKLPRSYKKGDIIEVKTVIKHPQHTGIGKKAKPAYYVNSIEVFYDGVTIARFDTHAAISKDPYFSFKMKAVKSAPLKVVWKDIKGKIFEKSVDINVGG